METNFPSPHSLRDPEDALSPKYVAVQYGIAKQPQLIGDAESVLVDILDKAKKPSTR